MVKYLWIAGLAVAFAFAGTGVQEASAQHGYGGYHHGHHGHHGHHHSGYHGGYGSHYGRLPVYRSGYGAYYGLGFPAYGVSRSSYYSGGSFPSTLGPYGGLGSYGNYGYLSHQPAAPRVRPRVQLRIGF